MHCYMRILFWESCTCTFAPQCLWVQANHPQGPNSVALLIAMSSTIQLCTEFRDTQPQDNKMCCSSSSSARFLLVLPLHLHSSGSRQLTKCHNEWLSPETDRHAIPLDHGTAWNIVFCEMSKWRCWFILIKRRDSWKDVPRDWINNWELIRGRHAHQRHGNAATTNCAAAVVSGRWNV